MELYWCSFQAPHASPRLRLMETHISLSSFSSSSLSSLNASSILPLELEMHILAIIYHHLVFLFLSSFCYKISFQLSCKGWRVIFIYIVMDGTSWIAPQKTENISLYRQAFADQHGSFLRSEGECLPYLTLNLQVSVQGVSFLFPLAFLLLTCPNFGRRFITE